MPDDVKRVEPNSDDHWLVRPTTVKWIWRLGYGVLGLTVLAQLLYPYKQHFAVDGWFAFPAIFGFLSCATMVFGARYLGFLLKRREGYYDDR